MMKKKRLLIRAAFTYAAAYNAPVSKGFTANNNAVSEFLHHHFTGVSVYASDRSVGVHFRKDAFSRGSPATFFSHFHMALYPQYHLSN